VILLAHRPRKRPATVLQIKSVLENYLGMNMVACDKGPSERGPEQGMTPDAQLVVILWMNE